MQMSKKSFTLAGLYGNKIINTGWGLYMAYNNTLLRCFPVRFPKKGVYKIERADYFLNRKEGQSITYTLIK